MMTQQKPVAVPTFVKSTAIEDEARDQHRMDEGKASSEGMRVGSEYQASVPDFSAIGLDEQSNGYVDPLQVWSPNPGLMDDQVDEFLKSAKEKHGYNPEQALGMLYWHHYDVTSALEDLKNFTPLPDEWSMEDRVIFDQSFQSYGKSFARIKQQLPEKSVGSLVKYYYTWKKNRNKSSLMDKEAKRLNKMTGGLAAMYEEDAAGGDSDDSDFENEKAEAAKPSPMLSTNCVNCAGVTAQMHSTPRGKMCTHCFEYWKRTGMTRPEDLKDSEDGSLTTLYRGPQHKLKKKPPKGMVINEEALLEIAQAKNENHIRPFDGELINLKRQLTTMKEAVIKQQESVKERSTRFRPPELVQKGNARWTNEELLVAVQCVRRYGRDFSAMSEVLGNKNIQQCHNFFVNYRRKYSLLEVLAEYEKENNLPRSDASQMEVWEEQGSAQSPALSNHSSASSKDGGKPSTSPNQPPPLYRGSDTSVSTPTTRTSPATVSMATSQSGPPPLVNNTPNTSSFSISSLTSAANNAS